MKEIIKKAESFIARDNSLKAIEYLKSVVSEEKKEVHKQLLLLENNYNSIMRKEIAGIENTDTISIQRNKLVYKLLNLLSVIESPGFSMHNNKSTVDSNEQNPGLASAVPKVKSLGLIISISLIIIMVYHVKTIMIPQTHDTISNNLLASSIMIIAVLLLAVVVRFKKFTTTKTKSKFGLNLSYESGIYGGLLGGLLVGLYVAINYYFDYRFHKKIFGNEVMTGFLIQQCILVVPFSAVAGIVIGLLSNLGMKYFEKLGFFNWNTSIIIGGITGASVATISMALLGVHLFVIDSNLPYPGPNLVTSACVLGYLFIALGLLFYSYRGKAKYIMRVLMIVFVILFFLAIILNGLIHTTAIKENLEKIIKLHSNDIPFYQAGALFGLILGGIGGSLIPLTVVLYKNWNYAEKQRLAEIKREMKDTNLPIEEIEEEESFL